MCYASSSFSHTLDHQKTARSPQKMRIQCPSWSMLLIIFPTSNTVSQYLSGRNEGNPFDTTPILVVVVGHTKCGGATASLAAVKAGSEATHTIQELPASDPLNRWLIPLTTLGISLKSQLTSKSDDEALQFLIEENVKKQVDEICKTNVIIEAWKNELEGKGKKVRVHGWIYDLGSGLLRDLKISRGP